MEKYIKLEEKDVLMHQIARRQKKRNVSTRSTAQEKKEPRVQTWKKSSAFGID